MPYPTQIEYRKDSSVLEMIDESLEGKSKVCLEELMGGYDMIAMTIPEHLVFVTK